MSWIGLRRQNLGTPRTTIRIFGAFLNHPASPRDPRDYVGRGEEGERKIERERERERGRGFLSSIFLCLDEDYSVFIRVIFRSVRGESLWIFGSFYDSILLSPFAFFSMKISVFRFLRHATETILGILVIFFDFVLSYDFRFSWWYVYNVMFRLREKSLRIFFSFFSSSFGLIFILTKIFIVIFLILFVTIPLHLEGDSDVSVTRYLG